MKEVTIGGLRFGAGIPKICIPLTGTNWEALEGQAKSLPTGACDLAEWRADCFQELSGPESLPELLARLRSLLPVPLLFTYRTRSEGGQGELSAAGYERLLQSVIGSGLADLVDLELAAAAPFAAGLIRQAHQRGVGVILSSHDFQNTPPKEELVARMRRMLALGADLPKVAVMPASPADVLALLEATEAFTAETGHPVITMSMGTLGMVSRLCGETFGSAMTFGTAGAASAPGQLPAAELAGILQLLHGAE